MGSKKFKSKLELWLREHKAVINFGGKFGGCHSEEYETSRMVFQLGYNKVTGVEDEQES